MSETVRDDGPAMRRALSLPLMVLYGLGVTVGAGIYVLIGETAGLAGVLAPLSFVLAALVMLPSALSFAELVGRLPFSAGEAAYVRTGFGSDKLALLVGLLVILVGSVSASAICIGAVGYIRQFLDLPDLVLIPLVVLLMACVACWGVRQSVGFAALMTVIEIGGLLAVIFGGFAGLDGPVTAQLAALPLPASGDMAAMALAVLSGGVLAFFAFIGFEDMVNMAEETNDPARTLPRAIFITLAVSTLLYVLVALMAVLSVPVADLAASDAPLSLVFGRATGASPATISAIAIVATLNGVIVQIIMAARVIHGLSRQGSLPRAIGRINPVTRTPLRATLLVGAGILMLALFIPLKGLAAATSMISLIIFGLVNMALLRIKLRGDASPTGTFIVPLAVPVLGVASCLFFILAGLL